MKLCESQFIWLSIWVCSLCSPCSLVLDDLNEALWNSIHLTKYLSLFTLFALFTCFQGFEWSSMNLNSFDQVFEFVHFVHLVHLFSRIWMKLYESQFIWPSIWVCSLCSLVLQDLNEALWISNSFDKIFVFVYFIHLFTSSQGFEWGSVNLK